MTPKEKAKELVDRYKDIEIGSEGFHSWGMTDWQAKQCAIICVDEILLDKRVGYSKDIIEEKQFWQQVKQEIEKA